MFTATQPSFRTMATSFAASALLTTLAIVGSASPAHAATTDGFVRSVESQINDGRMSPSTNKGVATVAVRVAADGKVLGAEVAQSSGYRELDQDALATARSVNYPKGDVVRTVAVVMTYGNVKAPSKTSTAWVVSRYVNAKGEALAAGTPAPHAG